MPTKTTFNQRVWNLTKRIPRGRVTTYGSIARALGNPHAARAVGQALNRNPHAPHVPCHRVVAANGHLTGYADGLPKKKRLLLAEGVKLSANRVDPSCITTFPTR